MAIRFSRIISVSVLVLVLPLSSVAQGDITVGHNVQVSLANQNRGHSEVVIAADPSNAKHLLAGSMLWPAEGSTSTQFARNVAYSSLDGGETWFPALEFGGAWSFDPTCAFGPDGTAFFAAVIDERIEGRIEGRIRLYRSSDGGRNWPLFTELPGWDRPFLFVDHSNGPNRGAIYMPALTRLNSLESPNDWLSAVTVYRSIDKGASFAAQSIFVGTRQERPVPGQGGAVRSDGRFVTSYAGERRGSTTQPNGRLMCLISGDESSLTMVGDITNAVVVDNGYCNGKFCSLMPSLAMDEGTSVFHGRIYISWADSRLGHAEVLLASSSDGGKSWTKAVVVSDDKLNPGINKDPDHFRPVVAVNSRGVVGVLWYDRRNSPDNLGYQPRFSASLDGGETFLSSVPVSDAGMSFDEGRAVVLFGEARGGGDPLTIISDILSVKLGYLEHHGVDGGDTAGLVADASDVFHPLWIDNRTGINQVWTAPVTVNGLVTKNGSPELEGLEDVSRSATIAFKNVNIDKDQETLIADAYLVNSSKRTLQGPIKVRVLGIDSKRGSPSIVNADNGLKHAGAVFDFSSLLKDGSLTPGAQAGPRHVIIHLAGTQIKPGDYEALFRMATLNVKVFARVSGH